VIETDELKPNEKKINKMRDIKRPTKVKEIRSFLKLYSYYRKFIKLKTSQN
jgi:hypothetical protein